MISETDSLPSPFAPSPVAVSAEHAHLAGLIFACPVTMDNPPACPLHALRRRPARDRFAWVQSLSRRECRDTVAHHAACMTRHSHDGARAGR